MDRRIRADGGGERLAQLAEMVEADLVDDGEAVDLGERHAGVFRRDLQRRDHQAERIEALVGVVGAVVDLADADDDGDAFGVGHVSALSIRACASARRPRGRSEEHTSELQSLMRNSYAVFCLKKKKYDTNFHHNVY